MQRQKVGSINAVTSLGAPVPIRNIDVRAQGKGTDVGYGLEQKRETKLHATSSRPGVIVIDTAFDLIASNSEAIQILTFPDRPEKIPDLGNWLTNRVRSQLVERRVQNQTRFVDRYRSARRTYFCRSFTLTARMGEGGHASPAMLLLLERNSNGALTFAEIAERFGLTLREQETVKLLLQGLTSKEIAERMKISPNTVKAFIRLIMVKMNVSTRSGIIGKLAESKNGQP